MALPGFGWMYIKLTLCVCGSLFFGITSSSVETNSFIETPEVMLSQFIKARAKTCGRIARPQQNTSQPMSVQFGIRLIDFDVEEQSNAVSLSVWLRYRWHTDCMAWNSTKFGGIKRFPFPAVQLWLPDILLVNTADASKSERLADVILLHTGRVFWAPHRKYRGACAFDLTNYPYDVQRCDLWFQSMAKRDSEMLITPYYKSPFDLSTYLPALKVSSDWEITANTSEGVNIPRDVGMILMYSRRASLRFSIGLRRRQGFLAYLLVLPCVLLSFLPAAIFCLPPERPDRNTLGMSLLTCLMLLLLLLVNVAPPSAGSIPKLGLYYGFNMCSTVLAVFFSVLVVNVANRANQKRPVPTCVATVLIRVLGRIVFVKDDTTSKEIPPAQELNLHFVNKKLNKSSVTTSSNTSYNQNEVPDILLRELESRLTRIDERIQRDLAYIHSHVAESRTNSQWKLVALVLDRMLFCVYIFSVTIALILLLPRP